MRYHELLRRVQEELGFDSPDGAVDAIRATLSTLGECLYRTERRQLASQLPQEAAIFLEEYIDSEVTRRGASCFTLEEFYDRVAARSDVRRRGGVERARAVARVLKEMLAEGVWDDLKDELPKPYSELLSEESPSPASPTRA